MAPRAVSGGGGHSFGEARVLTNRASHVGSAAAGRLDRARPSGDGAVTSLIELAIETDPDDCRRHAGPTAPITPSSHPSRRGSA